VLTSFGVVKVSVNTEYTRRYMSLLPGHRLIWRDFKFVIAFSDLLASIIYEKSYIQLLGDNEKIKSQLIRIRYPYELKVC